MSVWEEAEPEGGYLDYSFESQISESEDGPAIASDVTPGQREEGDEGYSEASWAVPGGLLSFGQDYVVRSRLAFGSERGE
ncbi:MAG: hypothetical protein KF727_11800 [Microbacteriaceae bacterium]|nr:hypothetical protein [Microbacteriaceae bacterium]